MSGNSIPKTHKWLFWLNIGLISTFFAEVISGADLFPYFHYRGIFMVVPIYLLHSLILITIIYRQGRPTLAVLYFAGTLFGMYEAYITKILWTPDWNDSVFRIGELAVFETAVLVFFWHAWMSFILPLLAAETWLTNTTGLLSRFPVRLQQFFLSTRGWIMIAVLSGLFITINAQSPRQILLSGAGVLLVLGLLGWLWRKLTRGCQYSLEDLLPDGKELTVMIAALAAVYLLCGITLRREAFPSLLGHMVIWGLYAVLICLFIMALFRSRSTAMPVSTNVGQHVWAAGIVVFIITAMLTETLPEGAEGIIEFLGWYGVTFLGLVVFGRQSWNIFRLSWQERLGVQRE
ncbi:MAG: hypothetical protein JXA13_07850 [Anaerolineales bacterium]|nr:hypothetical protein [Anaerolineales bacterium]